MLLAMIDFRSMLIDEWKISFKKDAKMICDDSAQDDGVDPDTIWNGMRTTDKKKKLDVFMKP